MNILLQVSLFFILRNFVFTQTTHTPFPVISILNYDDAPDSWSNASLDGSFVSANPTETVYNICWATSSPDDVDYCLLNRTRLVTQGPSTFHYTQTGEGYSESVGCNLQSTTAASCLSYTSDANASFSGNPITSTQTQLLCTSPLLEFLPVRVTAGIPKESTLSTGAFPTATESPWCLTTSNSSTPTSTTSRGTAGTVGARLGLWEAVAGGIVGVVVLL